MILECKMAVDIVEICGTKNLRKASEGLSVQVSTAVTESRV